jgi:uncharacterized protein (DUF952 family)
LILHIAARERWEAARGAGVYRGETLESEGFIHASTPAQIVATANRYYRGRTDLILLSIDPARVGAEIRWEAAANGELYPHIYGPLNVDAVVRVRDFQPGEAGRFVAPEGLAGEPGL